MVDLTAIYEVQHCPGHHPGVFLGLNPADGSALVLTITGRGGLIDCGRYSLDEVLQRFDNAHPVYTDAPRELVVAAYNAGRRLLEDILGA